MSNAIVYFTHSGQNNWSGESSDRSGNSTFRMAEMIQNAVGGELIQIEAVDSYPVDYDLLVERTKREQANAERPELLAIPDLSGYDVVFLGFPCWWGTVPMPVMTLLENEKLSGTTVAAFCTNEGSGMGRAEADIRAACPNAKVVRGIAVAGNDVDDSIERVTYWAEKVVDSL